MGLGEFLVESLDKAGQDLAGVADLLRILADDPNQRGSRIRLVQVVDALAERGDDVLVAWVLSEDVADDDDRLLDDVVDLGVDQIQQCTLTT